MRWGGFEHEAREEVAQRGMPKQRGERCIGRETRVIGGADALPFGNPDGFFQDGLRGGGLLECGAGVGFGRRVVEVEL